MKARAQAKKRKQPAITAQYSYLWGSEANGGTEERENFTKPLSKCACILI